MRALLAALLLCTVAGSPASAESTHEGYCSFDDTSDPRRPGVVHSLIKSRIVVFGTENPVSAVVTCSIVEEGVLKRSVTFSGTGVVVGADYDEYVGRAYNGKYCTSIDYTSDDTPTETTCFWISVIQIPPDEVSQLLCETASLTCE